MIHYCIPPYWHCKMVKMGITDIPRYSDIQVLTQQKEYDTLINRNMMPPPDFDFLSLPPEFLN